MLKNFLKCMLLFVIITTNTCGANETILIVGDSLSAAYGMPHADHWVALLSKKLIASGYTHELINSSISGNTTYDGVLRIPQLLGEHEPKIAIIALGSNDGLQGKSPQNMKRNLQTMIDECLVRNIKVILIGFRMPGNFGPSYTTLFAQAFAELHTENPQISFLPFMLAGFATDLEFFQADSIHPNVAAQPKILANIWPLLKPLL